MFKDRKPESAEAEVMKLLEGESDNSKGMRLMHKNTSVAQHHEHAANYDNQAFHASNNASDAHTEARIALKRGDKNAFLDKMEEHKSHLNEAAFHNHMALRHRMEAHVKAGHKVSDFLG